MTKKHRKIKPSGNHYDQEIMENETTIQMLKLSIPYFTLSKMTNYSKQIKKDRILVLNTKLQIN